MSSGPSRRAAWRDCSEKPRSPWTGIEAVGAGYRTRTGARSLEGCCAAITPIPPRRTLNSTGSPAVRQRATPFNLARTLGGACSPSASPPTSLLARRVGRVGRGTFSGVIEWRPQRRTRVRRPSGSACCRDRGLTRREWACAGGAHGVYFSRTCVRIISGCGPCQCRSVPSVKWRT